MGLWMYLFVIAIGIGVYGLAFVMNLFNRFIRTDGEGVGIFFFPFLFQANTETILLIGTFALLTSASFLFIGGLVLGFKLKR